ncbi:MAG: alpha/beta fold hydrolase [Dehalococcoidia bacterium]|nr:alpha/beta fold hydrolase [Dehalococcoidia bacterium]MCB9487047.1 alpha/beta fold hydrolase [Thermoflexaceae bacterium]
MSEASIRYARTDDGETIGFVTVGSGAPMIWLTAAGISQAALIERRYRAQLAEVGKHFLVVIVDGRGYGLSSREPADFSVGARASDIQAVANRLGFDRFHLFGHAHSSSPSIRYAAMNPDRVLSLVLSGPIVRGADV